ncbi:MAG: hypothetical protein Q4G50_12650 [Corynebacterium sp.]|uniref:hypothetical protein n=1 Tax=Corynebacterium sp. TaxID=1720 RepID=UPI0026DEB821|nr:hypothetical protein [Corynebacterium sp.]MDO5670836.1 hypothetical protein [Corynebacterium sp.]
MLFPRLAFVTAAVLLSGGLVACSAEEEPTPEPPVTTQATSVTPTPTTTSTAPPTETRETTVTTETSISETSRNGMPQDVAEVREIFRTVAPDSLFRQFEACNDSGINNAWECSGPEVGQFQFFRSMSKAASTTQLITELRSSRVVEDTGRKVVGWSTLGTTAVITVVDNEEGLVMQQMVSSDRVDPQERIYELGLATPPAEEEEESADSEA